MRRTYNIPHIRDDVLCFTNWFDEIAMGLDDEVLALDAERRSKLSQVSPPLFQIGRTVYSRKSTYWVYRWFSSKFEGMQNENFGAIHIFYRRRFFVTPSDCLPLHTFRQFSTLVPRYFADVTHHGQLNLQLAY